MKIQKIISIHMMCAMILFSAVSCAGKRKGWYKTSNDSHDPANKKQSGKAKSKS